MNTGTAALTFSLLALAPLLPAQEPAKNATTPAAKEAKEPFTLPKGELKLPELIDRCAAYLDCNILWDASGIAVPPIAVANAVSTDRAGCLEFLANSLRNAGFALTWSDQRTGRLEAIHTLGVRGREIMVRSEFVTEEQLTAAPTLCMPVMVFVQLHHITAPFAANTVRPMLAAFEAGSRVTIGSVGRTPALLLAGLRPDVAKVVRAIRETDQPAPDSPTDGAKRLAALEKRIAALEAQLAAQSANSGDKPAGSAEKPK